MTESNSPVSAPVIAIDGPSGAGKGTISRLVAQQLGWQHLDSGALYRIVAHAAMQADIALDAAAALAALVPTLTIEFRADTREGGVLLNGQDVTDAIRTETCGNAASKVATMAAVRTALVDLQRRFRRQPGLIADGRDMASTIFPDANLKIFLTASANERAKRRHKQLNRQGLDVSLDAVLCDLRERDRRDAERTVAPLKPALGAHKIDTTGNTIDEVVMAVLDIWVNVAGSQRSIRRNP